MLVYGILFGGMHPGGRLFMLIIAQKWNIVVMVYIY